MPGEAAYLRSLCDITRAFAAAERLAPLLDRIVENAVDSMYARAACVYIVDDRSEAMKPVARTGLSDKFIQGELKDMQRQIAGMREKGFFHIRDAAVDNASESRDSRAAEGIASILSVPVTASDKPIGVLSLYSEKPRDFSDIDIAFFTALAEQAGIAIDRTRIIEQLRNNALVFRELSSKISASLEIPEVMRMLTRIVIEKLGAKAASVRLIDSSDNALRLIASYGLSQAYIDKGPVHDDPGIPEALAGESLIISDAGTDDGVRYRQEKEAEGIVTILSIPIRIKEHVIGVLRLYYGIRRSFYKDEILMMEAIGHQAGLAIQNASCYMKLEDAMQDLQSDIWVHRSWL